MIIEQQIAVNAPITIIWNLITDVNDWSSWNSAISLSKMDAPSAEGSPFIWKSHGLTLRSRIEVIRVNEIFAWSSTGLGFTFKQQWELKPTEGPMVMVYTRIQAKGMRFMFRNASEKKFRLMAAGWLAALQKQAVRSCDFYQSRM